MVVNCLVEKRAPVAAASLAKIRGLRSIAFLALGAALACSDEPEASTRWTLPVSPGTRIVEVSEIPRSLRTQRQLDLVEDLSLGGGDDAENFFNRPTDLSVDDEGRIYVLDSGNYRVQVFENDGSFLRSFGRRGSGPGEFVNPRFIAVTGSRVLVTDRSLSRVTAWDHSGEYIGAVVLDNRGDIPGRIMGLSDGMLIASHAADLAEIPGQLSSLVRFALIGDNLVVRHVFADRLQMRTWLHRRGRVTAPILLPRVNPQVAATRGGDVYITETTEHKVLALTRDGDQRWALRASGERHVSTASARDRAFTVIKERIPEVRRGDVDWPLTLPALDGISVDGHRRLYVFPIDVPFLEDSPEVPVDVYSRDGEPVFRGVMPRVRWRAAFGSYVYAFRVNADTDEIEVVRYKLAPGDLKPMLSVS